MQFAFLAAIFSCLITTAAGFVGAHPVALLKPCNTALVYCSSFEVESAARTHTHIHTHTHTHTHTKFARAYIRTLSHVHAHALWCVQCFLGQTILESRSPCSPASTLLRMASSPERDASQCSTLQRLAKEREARASRIREICGRILNRRASDEAAGPRHLIVLAHGLMGGTTDLSFLKDCILELDPRALVLLSRSNQDKTTVWHGECTYAALNLSAACVCVCVCGAMSKHILSRTRSCSN